MSKSKWRLITQEYLPNEITFLSLSLGLLSIILAGQGLIGWAAACILACVILDSLDGFLARRLSAATPLGMQLDSLADIINFGVAPIFLVWQHLCIRGGSCFWILPFCLVQACAGAYRLARFNLQPQKQSSRDETLGLTITQAGLITALSVLADLSQESGSLPEWVFALLSAFLSYLMVSKMVLAWYRPAKSTLIGYLVLGGGLLFFSSFFTVLLVLYLSSLAVSIYKYLSARSQEAANLLE